MNSIQNYGFWDGGLNPSRDTNNKLIRGEMHTHPSVAWARKNEIKV